MDRLSELLSRFSINANVFFSGDACALRTIAFKENKEQGALHLLKSGALTVKLDGVDCFMLAEPAVIYLPYNRSHEIVVKDDNITELVCASIDYENGRDNPIANSLPSFIHFPLKSNKAMASSACLLFEEAFENNLGKQHMINYLCNAFFIHVLRYLLEVGNISSGILAGLSHPQLSKVITMVSRSLGDNWTLEAMSKIAAMSRSKFAEEFKATVGQSPGDYLIDLRIDAAKKLLIKNYPVGFVANKVGYENGSVLARVFRKKTGVSPRQWLGNNINKE